MVLTPRTCFLDGEQDVGAGGVGVLVLMRRRKLDADLGQQPAGEGGKVEELLVGVAAHHHEGGVVEQRPRGLAPLAELLPHIPSTDTRQMSDSPQPR